MLRKNGRELGDSVAFEEDAMKARVLFVHCWSCLSHCIATAATNGMPHILYRVKSEVTSTEYDVMECNDGGARVSCTRQMMLEMLQQVISELNGLKEISRKIEDDGVNLVNEINKLLYHKFGGYLTSERYIGSMYATDGDLLTTGFKTPEDRAKSINTKSDCLAPKKTKDKPIAI
ncbi:hypothetical protein V6N13_125109 [Hibiscus sabdariffa]